MPQQTHLAETVASADLAARALEHACIAEAALSVIADSLTVALRACPHAASAHFARATSATAIAHLHVRELAAAASRELEHTIRRDNARPSEVISYDRAFREEQLRASAATDPVAFAQRVRAGGDSILAARRRHSATGPTHP